jgi:AcrR family transcriptional regulator
MGDGVKRRYDAGGRRARSAQTGLRVVEAARALMLERGWAGTTMADVAARAGVAVQTVYTVTGGGKAALAKRVWDVTLAGDDEPVAFADRPAARALRAETDPRRVLAGYAAVSRQVYGRLGPVARVLRAGAAAGDADLVRLIDVTENERLAGSLAVCRHLAALGALRDDVPLERVAQRLWTITSGEQGDGLVVRCGWSLDEYEAWLAESMTAALLAPDAGGAPRG